jgi:dihydroneopterin aldolase
MARVLRRAQWEGEVVRSGNMDKIIVQNLEVVVNAGFDVWGRQKKQRALISVTLTLGGEFDSAASTDSVDDSTVHYGTLSKAIQQEFNDKHAPWIGTAELATRVARCVSRVAEDADVYAIETEICYIKGSMFGEGAGYIYSTIETSENRSEVMYLRNMTIPCLIGVNSNERLQKQPVVVNAWIDKVARSRVDAYPELESLLFKVSIRILASLHRLTRRS